MNDRELAKTITLKLTEVSEVFGQFQNQAGLHCPTDCGKCCFKPDISCSPSELLPLAFSLVDSGRADEVLEKARNHIGNHCLFLAVTNSNLGSGRCTEYQHRPFICRAFGLSARRGKNEKIERSICQTLSEIEKNLGHKQMIDEDIPLIEIWKKRLESIHPNLLQNEMPIHKGIVIILEKLLLAKSFSEKF